jgi:alkylation response protein AidB-like acyl-CoA dehydrogenase
VPVCAGTRSPNRPEQAQQSTRQRVPEQEHCMQFTHEHLELQRNLKRFIDAEINPYVDVWEQQEIFPAHQLFKKMGALGFLGICKPPEYGGLGLDYS